jgi:hypothetical protein
MTPSRIAENIAGIQARIDAALQRAGRTAGSVTLIAVTKNVEPERIKAAYDAGIRDFGENYLQEATIKQQDPRLYDAEIRWHFIGHLQKNKARTVLERFELIHSCDSLDLARELSRRSDQLGRKARTLLQVRLDPNEHRFGLKLDETLAAIETVRAMPGISLEGLMGMAPFADAAEAARPYFKSLSAVFHDLPQDSRRILSMGMTADFEVAVEEGATHVRIGTALFGPR